MKRISHASQQRDRPLRCWVCNAPITWAASETACGPACRQRLRDESYRVIRCREQSRIRRDETGLTLEEWARTLRYFAWSCAYCQGQQGSFETLDHVIPRALGGGTTRDNCVPACLFCNQLKGALPLDQVEAFSPDVRERVQRYLATRRRS